MALGDKEVVGDASDIIPITPVMGVPLSCRLGVIILGVGGKEYEEFDEDDDEEEDDEEEDDEEDDEEEDEEDDPKRATFLLLADCEVSKTVGNDVVPVTVGVEDLGNEVGVDAVVFGLPAANSLVSTFSFGDAATAAVELLEEELFLEELFLLGVCVVTGVVARDEDECEASAAADAAVADEEEL